jgi:hypothetical protein
MIINFLIHQLLRWEIWNDSAEKTMLRFKFSTIHKIIYWKVILKIKKEQNKDFFKLVLSISRSLMSLIRNSYQIFEVISILHKMNHFSVCQIDSHDIDYLLANSLLIDSFFKISNFILPFWVTHFILFEEN